MINFRFHLISLIAVFLALAVGVVMGYAVLGSPTVDTLQGRVDTVEARAEAIRGENEQLRRDNARLEDVVQEIDDYAVTLRVSGTSAVPVAARGVDGDRVAEVVRLGRKGGALVPGIIWLEPKWALTSEEDTAALATIVGTTATARAAVRDAAARTLAARLASGPPAPGRPDVLEALADAGFLDVESVDDVDFGLDGYDGRARTVLLVGGTRARVPSDRGVIPIARALVAAGAPVVLADEWAEVDRGPGRGEDLDAVRDDDTLNDLVATLDGFDAVDGPLVAVLVLGERARGEVSHYGFGRGAQRLLPEWWTV